MIAIIDYGSQFTKLIARRFGELNVLCEIVSNAIKVEDLRAYDGIVLSGSPSSVYDENAPEFDYGILNLGTPILGICYGMQVLCKTIGGYVDQSDKREYGKAKLQLVSKVPLWNGLTETSQVWMSHGDSVELPPVGFDMIAMTESTHYAAIKHERKDIYGIQFHPEVAHTQFGRQILANFAGICDCEELKFEGTFVEQEIAKIKERVGDSKVICGLSGGVDSAVTALMVNEAVGDQLVCIMVDNGLLRAEEVEEVTAAFKPIFGDRFIVADARDRFLTKLDGVEDPETKRKIIGAAFIDVFKEEALKIDGAKFLAQGTLYPDVIESSSDDGLSKTIKSHHNVGGLPEDLGFELIEPLRSLFKDEAREIGRKLGLPDHLVERQPFPGPGLSIRVLGAISEKKLEILRAADKIVRKEIDAIPKETRPWQYFCVLLPTKSVGVMGDGRTYEYTCVVRAVDATDGMTADWSKLDYELLGRISSQICNEVRGINRVCYDISSKPPATIEWE